MRARSLSFAFAAAVLLGPTLALGADELRGRVSLGLEGLQLADVAPVVVYLVPEPGFEPAPPPHRRSPEIRQHHARFEPGFLAIDKGQTVRMPNDDLIFHNVFSFSGENAFDLGFYPAGESREVRFEHAGAVRIYCSIHESMSATVFVAPTAWWGVGDAEGRFTIPDVPKGPWRAHVWSEKLPSTNQRLQVEDPAQEIELTLGTPDPQVPANAREP